MVNFGLHDQTHGHFHFACTHSTNDSHLPCLSKKFVETDFGNVPISTKSSTKTKPEVVNVYSNKPKIEAVWKIIDIVDAINNPLETNKVLEKTLITLRKLQQDIA